MDSLCMNIRHYRKQRGWTQADLAGEMDISRSTVAKWENAQLYPSLQDFVKLCEVYQVSMGKLYGKAEQNTPFLKEFQHTYKNHYSNEIEQLVKVLKKYPKLQENLYTFIFKNDNGSRSRVHFLTKVLKTIIEE
ncbi:helix-turn-helix transcriptional regulator [Bacillus sp. JZ8]